MKKRIFIFSLIILIIVIVLAIIPNIGYTTGGYSPEELERLVTESFSGGKAVRLANIKFNPVLWWPFTKTLYDKFSENSQIFLAFLIALPYWIIVSIIGAFIVEGIYRLINKFSKDNKKE